MGPWLSWVFMKTLQAQVRRMWWRFLLLLRQVELPGFQGMGLYDVLRFFINGLLDSKFTLLASAMAYQFFFSLFPTILLIYILLPLFPIEGLQDQVMIYIEQFVPNPQESLASWDVKTSLEKFAARSPNILLLMVSFSLVVWGATRGIIAMMKAFTKQEEVFKRRNVFQLYGVALMILMALGAMITVSVLLQIGEVRFIVLLEKHAILSPTVSDLLDRGLRFLLTVLTVFSAVATLYYLAPATHQRWKFISPGSIAASVLILAAMIGLKYYFNNFANFDWIYGGLGAIILLMVWFYYISIMLLIGFELNAAIDMASHQDGERIRVKEAEGVTRDLVAAAPVASAAVSGDTTSKSGE